MDIVSKRTIFRGNVYMVKKGLFIALGFLMLLLGAIGVVMPMLPTVPFLLLASICFMKGSERINRWFEGTDLYKKHVVTFREHKGMTFGLKLKILIPVYIMLIGLFIWKDILAMRIAIIILLLIKTIVFIKIKTIKEEVIYDGR